MNFYHRPGVGVSNLDTKSCRNSSITGPPGKPGFQTVPKPNGAHQYSIPRPLRARICSIHVESHPLLLNLLDTAVNQRHDVSLYNEPGQPTDQL